MTTSRAQSLERVLSFKSLLFIAVGQIIGGGVIALTGVAIGMTGPGVIAAYAAAALLVLIVSVPIMIAGATVPATGAFYAWPARLLNGWCGCITLFLILLASITLSLYGSAFGLYMTPLFPGVPEHYWGIGVITALVIANLFGLQLAASVQTMLVLILLSALAIFAGFAMPKLQIENLSPMLPNGIIGFATAVFLVKFATGGATNIVGLGGEMLNPARDIPRVIITATLSVAVIYCLVALASVGVVPWETMINQPLTVAGEAFLPGWALLYFLAGGAGLAVLTTLNAQLIQIPRNFLVASWDHLLPPRFGNLNRFGAPHYILFVMLVIGVTPLLLQVDISTIARAATISASLPAFFIYTAVLNISKRYPEQHANSLLPMKRRWLWCFFLFSQLSTAIGVALLARDLSATIIMTLVVWLIIAVAYYPLRRAYLATKGLDLDALTSNRDLIEAN